MAWDPWTHPIDYVVLAGHKSPGLAIVTAKLENKIDQVPGYYTSGATGIYHGRKPVSFTIDLKLCTPADYAEWATFRGVVLKPPRAFNDALAVSHPYLTELGIGACLIETVSTPTDDGTGMITIAIGAVEWGRRPTIITRPTASKDAGSPERDPIAEKMNLMKGQVQQLAMGKDVPWSELLP